MPTPKRLTWNPNFDGGKITYPTILTKTPLQGPEFDGSDKKTWFEKLTLYADSSKQLEDIPSPQNPRLDGLDLTIS